MSKSRRRHGAKVLGITANGEFPKTKSWWLRNHNINQRENRTFENSFYIVLSQISCSRPPVDLPPDSEVSQVPLATPRMLLMPLGHVGRKILGARTFLWTACYSPTAWFLDHSWNAGMKSELSAQRLGVSQFPQKCQYNIIMLTSRVSLKWGSKESTILQGKPKGARHIPCKTPCRLSPTFQASDLAQTNSHRVSWEIEKGSLIALQAGASNEDKCALSHRVPWDLWEILFKVQNNYILKWTWTGKKARRQESVSQSHPLSVGRVCSFFHKKVRLLWKVSAIAGTSTLIPWYLLPGVRMYKGVVQSEVNLAWGFCIFT